MTKEKKFWHKTKMPNNNKKKLAIIDGELYPVLSVENKRPEMWAYADDLLKYDIKLENVKMTLDGKEI